MRRMKLGMTAVAVLLAGTLVACGDAGDDDDDSPEVAAEEDCDDKFEEGSRMADLADAGEIAIGNRVDQPGLGQQDTPDSVPVGFDIDMAKLLIADLCIDPESDSVTWTEATSEQRETFLQDGVVDLVAASYSITDERRALVGQAGPYMITGQQVLVPADSDVESIADLEGQEVCAQEGSTSLENIEAEGAVGVPSASYAQCAEDVVNGTVPAMSTDGSILRGLAQQYEGDVKIVGPEFSEERIGIGYSKDYPEMCEWINDVLTEAFEDGTWEESFNAHLASEDEEAPEPPTLDECQA
ncbi:glutamate ABC transporter substrate-binding protein [Nocardioides bizhenqiangii]|uniref:Glutamate ABC transporter substrate-binding protein n=1 Tax=Nocardioides bizhenqiangii TaxID=3095076 RepID=A0ABZ0ZTS4_9ACTN|nr:MULTISPECIES: glutamate ABC transporter substrate-binding protein [unclassified Nocardioides]MDZ5622118.1 glutamate ABC transporter substrate-binding protein [Nocardioides sp. HM23]WQQ27211.1 glutamate ABC transporter substrate-binding protein [Nocardioides sp. HM61]